MTGSLWAFLAISIFVICTPGPDTAITVRNAIIGGRGAGVATACGVAVGQAIWALATGLGLVAILLASELIFNTIKLLGAVYLIWLGAQTIFHAFHNGVAAAAKVAHAGRKLERWRALRHGLLSDLGNPKMAAFFASVLPQFAPQGEGMLATILLLGALFAAMTFAWLALYVFIVTAVGGVLQRSRIWRALEGATGAILILLGVRLAAEQR
ncbi:LysE family translocator [Terrarubrum flagellatum]|uniref:LysE family translocator n=1 Tax=Terrirubrum flagellatum TaxID=2895980 RepID=UPI003144DFD6